MVLATKTTSASPTAKPAFAKTNMGLRKKKKKKHGVFGKQRSSLLSQGRWAPGKTSVPGVFFSSKTGPMEPCPSCVILYHMRAEKTPENTPHLAISAASLESKGTPSFPPRWFLDLLGWGNPFQKG